MQIDDEFAAEGWTRVDKYDPLDPFWEKKVGLMEAAVYEVAPHGWGWSVGIGDTEHGHGFAVTAKTARRDSTITAQYLQDTGFWRR